MPRGNPNQFIKVGHFVCECDREFEKSQSLYSHQSHCKVHLGDRYDFNKHGGWSHVGNTRAWSKGKTKDDPIYGESLRKLGELKRKSLLDKGSNNPIVKWNKNKPKESYERQSETRKKKYLSGELTPAPGVGRGKYSYLQYDNKCIMLRSTYEFIYALYLLYNNIEFEYESVRVKFEDHTYLSDFLIDNHIIEIKGNYHASTINQKKAFESAGYTYEVKFWDDISECYEYLKSKLDIDDILNKIIDGHNSKNYYKYYFN